jgi:hypothetical protein
MILSVYSIFIEKNPHLSGIQVRNLRILFFEIDFLYYVYGGIKSMDLKCRLKKITLLFVIIAGVSCACYGVLLVADEYYRAQNKLNMCRESVEGWEACRKMKPEFYEANTEAVSASLEKLDEAQQNFWVNLPKGQLVGLYVLAGFAGAIGGCLVTWILLWFGGLAIYETIRWFIIVCCGHSGRRKSLRYQ